MAPETGSRTRRACAAVVLYRPDIPVLAKQAQGLAGVRLFAFANGSLDPGALAALAPTDLVLIESAENLGLGHGLNILMEAAREEGFDHVLLLDQDSEPAADLIPALSAKAALLAMAQERVAVVAPLLVPPESGFYKPIAYHWHGAARPDGLTPVDFPPTSGSLVDLGAYAEIGRFRDDFFIAGIDVEWGFRAWSKGWSCLVNSSLSMPHRWGEAASEQERERPQILRHAPIRNYYYARNVLAVARLPHIPWGWRLRSCAALAAQTALVAFLGSRGSLRPVMAGLRDGLKGRLGPAPPDAI